MMSMMFNANRSLRILLTMCAALLVWTSAAAQEVEMQALAEEMRQKVSATFAIDPAGVKDDVVVLATRSLVARTIAETVNRSKMTIDFTVAENRMDVPKPQELRTEKHADANIECSEDQFCNRGCDSSNFFEKAACEVDKKICKSTQKLECESRKSLAQLISNKKLATVSFRNVTVKGRATAGGISLSIAPALDAVTMTANVNASLELSVDGHFAPEPLITAISGCAAHDFTLRDESVSMGQSGLTISSSLNIEMQGDAAVVKIEPSRPTVTLRFAGTPALRFISRNPVAFLKCSIPYSIAAIADVTHPNDMAKLDQQLPLPAQSQTLGTLSAKVNGWVFRGTPHVTANAVGVTGTVGEDATSASTVEAAKQ
jgi:hypothetical protein